MKKCRCCERPVPSECTGEIEDHCDWCGGPYKPTEPPLAPDARRWCNDQCLKEDDEWAKEIDSTS